MALIPTVIEKTNQGERAYDIYSRLLNDRIIMLSEDVNHVTAASIVAQLLYLDADNSKEPIYFYINSPGGVITDGMAIFDTMQYISAPVYTICVGLAASMGSFLLSGGEKGYRMALPNAEIMVHQPLGGAKGQATDILIAAEHIMKTKEKMIGYYSDFTGKSKEEIGVALERDNFMTAQEALEFGLIDSILYKKDNSK